MLAAGFTWFHLIPAVDHDTLLAGVGITKNTFVILHAWLACAMLIGAALIARMGIQRASARPGIERFTADDRLTPRTIAELFAGAIQGIMGDTMPKSEVRFFFPFIAGIFAYIFTCNIVGIIPGLLPPTENINNNVGMALVVFVVFNLVGLMRDPVGYVKHLAGPVWWLAFFMFPLEVLSLMLRPLSLTLRLTGNMYGDHQVFSVFSDLVPAFVPVPFLALACFVSGMQALVFSLLTSVYIGLSLPHHDHDAHH